MEVMEGSLRSPPLMVAHRCEHATGTSSAVRTYYLKVKLRRLPALTADTVRMLK